MEDYLVNCPHCQYINDVAPAVHQLNRNEDRDMCVSRCRQCKKGMTVMITMRGVRILETLLNNYGELGAEVPGGLTSEIVREDLRGPEGPADNTHGQNGIRGAFDERGEDQETPGADT